MNPAKMGMFCKLGVRVKDGRNSMSDDHQLASIWMLLNVIVVQFTYTNVGFYHWWTILKWKVLSEWLILAHDYWSWYYSAGQSECVSLDLWMV